MGFVAWSSQTPENSIAHQNNCQIRTHATAFEEWEDKQHAQLICSAISRWKLKCRIIIPCERWRKSLSTCPKRWAKILTRYIRAQDNQVFSQQRWSSHYFYSICMAFVASGISLNKLISIFYIDVLLDCRQDQAIGDETVFSKDRYRLLSEEIIHPLFMKAVTIAQNKGLLSSEHFSVDNTLIQSWASLSVVPKKTEQTERMM